MTFPRVLMSIVLVLLVPLLTAQTQTWDVSSGAPPVPRRKSLAIPHLRIEPLRLVVFEQCEPDGTGAISHTGKLSIQLSTVYPSIGFVPTKTDSTLTLRLRTRNDRERDAPFSIPQQAFTLRVILGEDTAQYAIDHTADHLFVECKRSSELLVLEPVLELDADVLALQFFCGTTQEDVRKFVHLVKRTHGDAIKMIQIAAGYYPCLPVPDVSKASIGGRRNLLRVNKSSAGYLVCVRISDSDQFDLIAIWINNRQAQELERFKLEPVAAGNSALQQNR